MKFILLLIGFLVLNLKLNAALCTATVTGNWENPAVWSCGHVPLCTDNITIPSGYTVTITSAQDYNTAGCTTQTMVVTVAGALQFQTGKKLTLPSASIVVVAPGAQILPGNGGGNSNYIQIGTIEVWKAGDGPLVGPLLLTSAGLPIELLDFSGNCINGGVQLNWSTATEVDNESFLVEKSANGIEWQMVAKITGNGTTGTTHHYIHNDYEVNANDLTYYRLSQIDRDQTKTIFRAIDVNCGNNVPEKMVLFSNPASTELNIQLSVNAISTGNLLKIVNNVGQIVLETKINLNKGINSFIFPIDLNRGTYHIVLVSDKVVLPGQKLLIIE